MSDLNKPENPPDVTSSAHEIWPLVIKDMNDRHNFGKAKYGTGLRGFNGRDALVDAYQEALDLCVYLRQAIYERAQLITENLDNG